MSCASATKPFPPWLTRSQSLSHIRSVLQTLSKREDIRESARCSSRHQTDPSSPSHRGSRFSLHIRKTQINQKYVDYYSVAVGYLPQNLSRNRYMELEPYDRTRVVVGHGDETGAEGGEGEGRYLNANWVLERFGGKWWIASQAPLPNTAHPFLSLILQPITRPPPFLQPSSSLSEAQTSRVRTIVQLTMDVESGRRKAHNYFPSSVGQSWVIPPEEGCFASAIKVTLSESQAIEEAHCIQSTISIVPLNPSVLKGQTYDDNVDYGGENPVTFRHMLYTAWPDHGVPEPEDRASLLAFLRLVDRTNKDLSLISYPESSELDPDPPIIVGCSAGIGRTGSFIALSSLLRAQGLLGPYSSPASSSTLPISPLGPLPDALKEDLVVQEVDSLREQRPGMVQREEQILLIYEVLASALLE